MYVGSDGFTCKVTNKSLIDKQMSSQPTEHWK